MKNYHTHTTRCMHAFGSEEDYIKAAIEAGYTELGFSDHSPWGYHSSFVSSMRMREDELKGYVDTIKNLKEKYKNQISIRIGLECEYFREYMPWLKKTLQDYSIDYIILGNHYDDTDETGIYFGRPLSKKQLSKYVDNCIEGLKTGLYSYLAHPDLGNYDVKDPFYYQEMKRLCLAAKECQIPLEFNLLGYETHRHYPNDIFFTIVKEVGNQVIIGVDAHEPSALLNTNLYQEATQHIKELGLELINEIKFLKDER